MALGELPHKQKGTYRDKPHFHTEANSHSQQRDGQAGGCTSIPCSSVSCHEMLKSIAEPAACPGV